MQGGSSENPSVLNGMFSFQRITTCANNNCIGVYYKHI